MIRRRVYSMDIVFYCAPLQVTGRAEQTDRQCTLAAVGVKPQTGSAKGKSQFDPITNAKARS